MPIINFLNSARDSTKVSAHTRKVLGDIMKKSGVNQITITSTARTASEQARVMYENIEKHGVAHQKKLYGSSGDKVIDEYSSLNSKGKSKSNIILGMSAKITSLGAGRVSRHAADPKNLMLSISPPVV